MRPILYDRYSQHSVVGVLEDCISCTVTQEINGIFECEFQYPMIGPYYQYMMQIGGMVEVMAQRWESNQYFDIYKYSAPINGIVTFYASHVSYRLSNIVVEGGWTATDPNQAFAEIGNHLKTNSEFTLRAGAPWDGDAGEMSPVAYSNVRSLLLNREQGAQSMLSAWEIEFEFDNFDVFYHKKLGYKRGFEIRFGKNMTSFLREKDSSSIVSRIFPYWKDQDGNIVTASSVTSSKFEVGQSPWTYPYTYINPSGPPVPTFFDLPIKSSGEQIYFRPPQIIAAAMDFSDQFQAAPTQSQLRAAARRYMSQNSTWRANDNITVEFLDLYNAPEYEDIKDLEECALGDFVNVIYTELGVEAKDVEIVSTTFDALDERYTQMQLNTIRTTLAQTIIDYIGGAK